MARRRSSPPPADPSADPSGEPAAGGVAIAFPGQGIDPNDLAAVLHEHPEDPLVTRLGEILGTSDWNGLDLDDTRIGQPSVYVGSVLSAGDPRHAALVDPVAAVFGHSLGELSAAAFAGAFDPLVGLDLVVRRAELGHARQEERPGRMIVVMRLAEPDVEWVRRRVVAGNDGLLEMAVLNGTGQFVLSGDLAATDTALDLIAELGGVGRRLAIGGGYHSPLMAPVVAPYREALEAAVQRDPRLPLVSCTTQRVVTTRDELVTALARALVLPVRWVDTLEAVRAMGITSAVDAGPSQTLTNLARFSPVLEFASLRPEPRRG